MRYHLRSLQALLLLVIVGSVLIVLTTLFVVVPSVRSIRQIEREITTLRAIALARAERAKQARASLTALEEAEQVSSAIQKIFLAPGREIEYIERIEAVADAVGVQQAIRLDKREAGGHAPFTISLTVRAPFSKLVAYLYLLEHGNAFLHMDEIAISATEIRPSGAPEVTATIHVQLPTLNNRTIEGTRDKEQ